MFAVLLTIFTRTCRCRSCSVLLDYSCTKLVALVLPEIEALCWMNLSTYRNLEIFVRNFAITVCIEFVEQVLELLVSYSTQAPVLEIEPKLFWFNAA